MTLQVVSPPQVPELYFWALQASFGSSRGLEGGAHLGLQWHPQYPGSTAVNWGGYDRSGQTLAGPESPLPSSLGNANTRDYPWRSETPYRLRIYSHGGGWWAGEVTDLVNGDVTVVRSLAGGGEYLTLPMVWSEVFARCDAPSTAVVWAAPAGMTIDGSAWRPDQYTTSYQTEANGGCSNTDSRLLPGGVTQLTAVARSNPAGAQLPA
ncbi:MAG TPA: hypothetical protein VM470_06065 [Acidimicrobiia bacterium]|nr:hypothetical protein [Acidimicrobiia bacterium]